MRICPGKPNISSSRTWVLAAVVALVSFNVSAEALSVGPDETVTVASAAYDGMTVQGTLVIPSGGAVTSKTSRITIDGGTILLNDGAVLRVAGIDFGASGNDSSVIFNGGQLTIAGQITSKGAGNLDLVCTNDYDVALNYVGSTWIYLFAFGAEATGKAYVKGDNSFVISLSRTSSLSSISAYNDTNEPLVLLHAGQTKILNNMGNFDEHLFAGREVLVGYGAKLSLSGNHGSSAYHHMMSLVGSGAISGSRLGLTVPEGEVGKCFAQTYDIPTLRKYGDGRLDVFHAAPTNLTVDAGEVRVLPRSQAGYSGFRLKIDGVGTPAKSGMIINSFALYSGENDITAERASAESPNRTTAYVDKFLDGTNNDSLWFSYNDETVNPSFDDAYVDVRYHDHRIVTGYKLRTSRRSGGDWPKSWRLFGRDSGGEWELLDQRVDETLPSTEYTWTGEFPATIPADADATSSCKTMKMSSGSKLTVLSNATFVCSALSTSGSVAFDFNAGSSVDIAPGDETGSPTDAEIIVSGTSVLDGALAKSGSGALTLTGLPSSTELAEINVKEGTLAFRTAFLPWKYWKFTFCAVDARGGGAKGISVDEVAVYDADGNRLNVTGTVTMASLSETSFSDYRKNMMYDDIVGTMGFLGSVPDPNDEETWIYTSFVLSEAAPAVVGYNLKSGGSGEWNRWPKSWKVYAREKETDEWLLVDSKTEVTTPNSNSTWYNGGQPWYVTTTQVVGAAAFPLSAPVTVGPGATLDLSYSNATTISRLVVDGDASGYGTIVGGTYAAEGAFDINVAGETLNSPFELPLLIDGTSGAGMFSGWKVVVNGVERKNLRVLVSNAGRPVVVTSGTVVIIR